MPGAWAPSTSVSTPCRSSSRTRPATGPDEGRGRGDLAHQREPGPWRDGLEVRLHDLGRVVDRERDLDDDDPRAVPVRGGPQRVQRGVVLVVGGEQLVAGLEPERREHGRHAVVALGTKTMPSGVRVEERATSRRASSRRPSSSRSRKRTGSASSRSRQARCASSTGSGHAPKLPWLRNDTEGSSSQGERSKVGWVTSRTIANRRVIAGRRQPKLIVPRAICPLSPPALRPVVGSRPGIVRRPRRLRRLRQPRRRSRRHVDDHAAAPDRRPLSTRDRRSGPATNGATYASTRIGIRIRNGPGKRTATKTPTA